MKKLVVLTGAGISAESGIKTFRDSDGLWENYDVMTVASINGWRKCPELVTKFYNERRRQLPTVEPNLGHIGLKDLEEFYDVTIVTQNVDNLHERAGSSNIIHLHGELTKVCDEKKQNIQDIGYEDSPEGVRPFIVFFGEDVPKILEAQEIVSEADILVIIGTSMLVYPAAGLVDFAKPGCKIYIINPNDCDNGNKSNRTIIQEVATEGVKILKELLFEL